MFSMNTAHTPKFSRFSVFLIALFVKVANVVLAEDTCGPPTMSDEQRLHSCLLANLDSSVRPAQRASDTVSVTVDSIIVRVMDVDEKAHVMTTAGWIRQSWRDFQLTWEPADYGGLTQIRLPVEKIWVPDIVLFNNADDSFRYVLDKLAIVRSDGTVTWSPHSRLRSYCSLDLSRFPFDKQTCHLVLGSWTHDVTSVNITNRESVKPQYMIDGEEWIITSTRTKRFQWDFGNSSSYAGITTTVDLKRDSSFYQYIFILPTVILATLMLLIPFIDPRHNERLVFCVALMLGCVMTLMMLEQEMPTEMGTVPIVAAYIAYLMVMLTIQMMFSILVANMYSRDSRQGKIPGWVRWTFLSKLNALVCVTVEPYTALPAEFAADDGTERELLDMRNGTSGETPARDGGRSALEQTMDDIRRYLRVLAARSVHVTASHRDLVIREWQQVARVIDRLLFASTLLLTVVITISMYSHY